MNTLKPVDHAALGTNQAIIIGLLIIGFILNQPIVPLVVAVFMLSGTTVGKPGFLWVYKILAKSKLVKPDVLQDNPEPHRFAQGFGGFVVAGSTVLLLSGLSTLGWALSWLVVALAALNLFVGFCVGCAMYYWLNKLRLPGFNKTAPAGRFPGLRPGKG